MTEDQQPVVFAAKNRMRQNVGSVERASGWPDRTSNIVQE